MTFRNQQNNWARELSKGLISLEQLKQEGLAENYTEKEWEQIKNQFDIRVPQSFLHDIKQEKKHIAHQFIPSPQELVFLPEELEDPIGDEAYTPVEGLTHRYPDRVLLKPTYQCAGYCRFCFRRYKVSHTEYNLKEESLQQALEYIKVHNNIQEVILTGGDPLTLTDKQLEKILVPLSEINHLKIIRVHTRVPTLLPSRITTELVEKLKSTNKAIWVAAHINHADEFKDETKKALCLFIDQGIPVIMQSVLLKGVNNTTKDLTQLFRCAVENRVKPYYLHYPDLAKGTNHFRVPLSEAIAIFKTLRGKISGLCIPQFIVDIPGGKGKIEINPHYSQEIKPGLWEFESPIDGSKVQVQYE